MTGNIVAYSSSNLQSSDARLEVNIGNALDMTASLILAGLNRQMQEVVEELSELGLAPSLSQMRWITRHFRAWADTNSPRFLDPLDSAQVPAIFGEEDGTIRFIWQPRGQLNRWWIDVPQEGSARLFLRLHGQSTRSYDI